MKDDLSVRARQLSLFKKRAHLLKLSEREFRDQVIRPLFLRRGLSDGRDMCGPDEAGKDTYFIAKDQLGIPNIYAVQTKKGTLNLSRRPHTNLLEAIVQLKTALGTPISLVLEHKKVLPTKVILCVSGTINEAAKRHIVDDVSDPRISFMDADDFVPQIDELLPELWYGIDAEVRPYLRALRQEVEEANEDMVAFAGGGVAIPSAATDGMFVPLRLERVTWRPRKWKGEIRLHPEHEEVTAQAITWRRERLVLVVGDAGSGKSTLLKRIAYTVVERSLGAESDPVIPVLLRAIAISSDVRAIPEICADQTRQIAGATSPAFASADLEKGRVVLLVDALDEVGDEAGRQAVLSRLVAFHRDYPACQIILTTRRFSALRTMSSMNLFIEWRLVPITYKQAYQILQRLAGAKALPQSQSKEILRRIQDVHGMELSPLLVSVFAATSEYSRSDVPANITELFKKFTELMLGRWDGSKGLGEQYQAPLKSFVISRVALEMHRRRVTRISEEEFRHLISADLTNRGHRADAAELVDEILYRSSLLRTGDGGVEFRHLLLQEFFAGKAIGSIEFLKEVLPDEWWQRVVLFYFGERPDGAEGLRSLIESVVGKRQDEQYRAALAIGLALQACYLVEVSGKQEALSWVVGTIADSKEGFLEGLSREGRPEVTSFIWYYLLGRDAVACAVLRDSYQEILKRLILGNPDRDEIRTFWVIVGLLESGALEEADKVLRTFHPRDTKLLLGVHLGCFLIENLRVTSRADKTLARNIRERMSERIAPLRRQFLEEFRSELLELRKGQPQAVESDE